MTIFLWLSMVKIIDIQLFWRTMGGEIRFCGGVETPPYGTIIFM